MTRPAFSHSSFSRTVTRRPFRHDEFDDSPDHAEQGRTPSHTQRREGQAARRASRRAGRRSQTRQCCRGEHGPSGGRRLGDYRGTANTAGAGVGRRARCGPGHRELLAGHPWAYSDGLRARMPARSAPLLAATEFTCSTWWWCRRREAHRSGTGREDAAAQPGRRPERPAGPSEPGPFPSPTLAGCCRVATPRGLDLAQMLEAAHEGRASSVLIRGEAGWASRRCWRHRRPR